MPDQRPADITLADVRAWLEEAASKCNWPDLGDELLKPIVTACRHERAWFARQSGPGAATLENFRAGLKPLRNAAAVFVQELPGLIQEVASWDDMPPSARDDLPATLIRNPRDRCL